MPKRVALVGMYAGFFRDYNPGCFLILIATLRALKARVPDAVIDVYARDAAGHYAGLRREVVDDVAIDHFTQGEQLQLLDGQLSTYDVAIFGGDVVWGHGEPLTDLFFLRSVEFLKRRSPRVAFNCVHTFLSRADLGLAAPGGGDPRPSSLYRPPDEHRRRLSDACQRADYVAVRTPYVQAMLQDIGLAGVRCVPDPAFLTRAEDLGPTPANVPRATGKPLVGISAGVIDPFLDAVNERALNHVDLLIYPYSMQYHHLRLVLAAQRRFGDRFRYVDRYLSPLETASLVSQLSASITHTYHGTLLALVLGIPFVCFDFEPDADSSRLANLLRPLGLDERRIAIAHERRDNYDAHVAGWHRAFDLIDKNTPMPVDVTAMREAVGRHFDALADLIVSA